MFEGSYGREPFDLSLTVLRLIRNLHKIAAVVLAGAILIGGGYYVKNVLLAKELYTATVTCKIEYTEPPAKAGDYYINSTTWNTYVDSWEFLDMVLSEAEDLWGADDPDALREAVSADVPSDVQVPTFTVVCDTEVRAEQLERAVAAAVTGPWADRLAEVSSIEVIDMGAVHPYVDEFVRPARAFVFGAVLTCFFAVVLFLLREIGADSIWLPATLRSRYGLMALGTAQSGELAENIRYAFAQKSGRLQRNAICAVSDEVDPGEVLRILTEKNVLDPGMEWTPLPAPVLSPEVAGELRGADGVMLVAQAGLHAGKPLEHTLEFFREQDIKITGVLLWDADEMLICNYYRLWKKAD